MSLETTELLLKTVNMACHFQNSFKLGGCYYLILHLYHRDVEKTGH